MKWILHWFLGAGWLLFFSVVLLSEYLPARYAVLIAGCAYVSLTVLAFAVAYVDSLLDAFLNPHPYLALKRPGKVLGLRAAETLWIQPSVVKRLAMEKESDGSPAAIWLCLSSVPNGAPLSWMRELVRRAGGDCPSVIMINSNRAGGALALATISSNISAWCNMEFEGIPKLAPRFRIPRAGVWLTVALALAMFLLLLLSEH